VVNLESRKAGTKTRIRMKHHHQIRPGDIDWVCTQQANAKRRWKDIGNAALDHGLFVIGAACFFAAGWMAKGWL